MFVSPGSVSVFVSGLMAAGWRFWAWRRPDDARVGGGSTGRGSRFWRGSSFLVVVSAGQRLGNAGGLEPGDLHRPFVRGLGNGGMPEGRPGLLLSFGVPLPAG